ncbi:MAG: 1-acyl-sn-glycerol-3-phosphate acyltransferase, partial [Pyrinomonadaceae bacterium]
MASDVKILRLGEMVSTRQGSFLQRIIHFCVGVSLRFFFRKIETVNVGIVPNSEGVLFVINHTNGLIDPALLVTSQPRRISFLAKSTLFEIPVLSTIIKAAGALPIYRRVDSADLSKNIDTFDVCRKILNENGAIALFPEGVSHSSPKLMPMKSGAARIALGAASENETSKPLRIAPVGIYYT